MSHSARLLSRGTAKVAQKFGEESVECLIEAVAGNRDAVVAESADVLYHLIVLWVARGIRPEEVWDELKRREGISGIAEKAARAKTCRLRSGWRRRKSPDPKRRPAMAVSGLPPYDDTNIFARILRGEIPNRTVYEDQWALAFHDISPQAPVHVLVIPKGKYVSFADFSASASADEIAGFMRAIGKVAKDLGLEAQGYRLLANMGEHSGQEVPHFHVHLFAGRPLGRMLPPG